MRSRAFDAEAKLARHALVASHLKVVVEKQCRIFESDHVAEREAGVERAEQASLDTAKFDIDSMDQEELHLTTAGMDDEQVEAGDPRGAECV